MKSLIIQSLLVFCCLFSSHASMDKNHGMGEGSKRSPLDLRHKAQILGVLEANELVHASFYKYKAKAVESSAKKLKALIKKIKHQKVVKTLTPALKLLDGIKAKSKRDANNLAYHKVSLLLAKVVNTYDVGDSYNVYSCPMVKKTWIQNSKKQLRTHNPYAPEMPHCGGRDTEY